MKTSLLLFLLILSNQSQSQPPPSLEGTINCVVLIEEKINNKFSPIGTGFLVPSAKVGYSLLFTANHLIKSNSITISIPSEANLVKKNEILKGVMVGNQLWEYDNNMLRTTYVLKKDTNFLTNDTFDFAIIDIPTPIFPEFDLKNTGPKFTRIKAYSLLASKKNIVEGIPCFFLGFPIRLGTYKGWTNSISFDKKTISKLKINSPIFRKGSIAWYSETETEFLLDAYSLPGSSGSPIFAREGDHYYLLGMVIGHLGIQITEEKDTFTLNGNSGLTRAVWMDDMLNFVEKKKKLIE